MRLLYLSRYALRCLVGRARHCLLEHASPTCLHASPSPCQTRFRFAFISTHQVLSGCGYWFAKLFPIICCIGAIAALIAGIATADKALLSSIWKPVTTLTVYLGNVTTTSRDVVNSLSGRVQDPLQWGHASSPKVDTRIAACILRAGCLLQAMLQPLCSSQGPLWSGHNQDGHRAHQITCPFAQPTHLSAVRRQAHPRQPVRHRHQRCAVPHPPFQPRGRWLHAARAQPVLTQLGVGLSLGGALGRHHGNGCRRCGQATHPPAPPPYSGRAYCILHIMC